MYLTKTARRYVRAMSARHKFARWPLRVLLTAAGVVEMARAQVFFLRNKPDPDTLRPDFICIGAQKAGTTWLDTVLRAHPDVAMPQGRKEVHYFTHGFWKGTRWYLWHWRHAAGRLRGEVTPRYTLLEPPRLEQMRALNPQMKLILILRNPVERAWSMAVMDLCKDPGVALADVPPERLRAHFHSKGSVARSCYSDIITRYQSIFARDQLGIFLYDDLLADPAKFWAAICRFLGLDPDRLRQPALLEMRENVGGESLPIIHAEELCRIYLPEIENLRPLLGDQIPDRWRAQLRRFGPSDRF